MLLPLPVFWLIIRRFQLGAPPARQAFAESQQQPVSGTMQRLSDCTRSPQLLDSGLAQKVAHQNQDSGAKLYLQGDGRLTGFVGSFKGTACPSCHSAVKKPWPYLLTACGYAHGLRMFSYCSATQARWMFSRPAVLELTHNWGTESDKSFAGFHSGNTEPKGFGHIGLAVPDVYAACERFEK